MLNTSQRRPIWRSMQPRTAKRTITGTTTGTTTGTSRPTRRNNPKPRQTRTKELTLEEINKL